jgi:gliding motility-associated protein GldM
MSIPKEPRQIMINLMYLVLTAMLALNISSEILHAFKILNTGIMKSNESIGAKNDETMRDFQINQDMKGNELRVKPFNDKAKAIKAKAAEVYAYLEEWKGKVIKQAGGYEGTGTEKIKREDDIDASTHLLVEQKGGEQIKAKLSELRDFMLANVDNPQAREAFAKDLPIQIVNPVKSADNPNGDWSTGTFYHVPVLGVVALMSKMQNDVRNSESSIINQLFKEAEAIPLKFDAITGLAVAKTSYALVGQPIEANIMVAAYNTTVRPEIRASTGSITEVKNGIGVWKSTAAGLGLQTVRGTISVNNNGEIISKPWEFQYMVGSAGASLQLDKMNVFYIGVPNPITVTAAGYSLEDVSISIPGATLTSTGKGKYDVTVTTAGTVNAAINAKTAQGVKQVGGMPVRVKRIPDPVAKVANKMGGGIPANIFRAQLGIAAILENFDFDAKFTVTSFDFAYQKRRQDYQMAGSTTGAYFAKNPEIDKYMKIATPGDRVWIENIRAVGPDKTQRMLNSISFLLQ